MSAEIQETLRSSAAKAVEEFCFVNPLAEGTHRPTPADLEAVVRVTFTGPAKGELVVLYKGTMLTHISSVLNEGKPPPLRDVEDCAKELGNIACGNILPFIGDEKALFKIAPPEVIAQAPSGEPQASAKLEFEMGTMELRLYAGEKTPEG